MSLWNCIILGIGKIWYSRFTRDPKTFDNQIQSDQKLEIVKVCGQSYLIITGPYDKDTDAK